MQKGLQYIEVETHTNEDGTLKRCAAPFSLVHAHECDICGEDEDPKEEARKRMMAIKKEEASAAAAAASASSSTNKRDRKESGRKPTGNGSEKRSRKESVQSDLVSLAAKSSSQDAESPGGMVSTGPIEHKVRIGKKEISVLEGHESDVFVCVWNPKYNLIATGSGDGTARIWRVPGDPGESVSDPIVLQHSHGSEQKDVTTLDWNANGNLLATGSYDGLARIWNRAGELKNILRRHTKPVFSLKWNKKGDLLLTGSMDQTAIIWDAYSGECRQQFAFHEGPTLDVDWRDDVTFATSSSDTIVYVCRIGNLEPVRTYAGHTNEVNVIKWDPTGTYLASCSDDHTARIWTMESDSSLWTLTGHTQAIYSLRWGPAPSQQSQASSSSNPVSSSSSSSISTRRLLATASFDSTVRVWDVGTGSCLHVLEAQSLISSSVGSAGAGGIYSVCFSPDGAFLASGSMDRMLCVWRVRDGHLVRTYTGSGGIYEVGWSLKGDKVTACFAGGAIVVAHLPTLKDRA